MRWQRVVRMVVAAVGLGCAVAIFLYTRSGPVPPAPPTSLAKIDPKAALEGGPGQTIYFGRQSEIKITFGATRSYEDGRTRSEKVEIAGLEGARFTVRADVLETSGRAAGEERPSHLNLLGHVVLLTDDGLQLDTDQATYDDATSQLAMPNAVTFTKGRLSGRGVGAAYDREQDSFTFLDQSTARVEPDATGRGAVDASSTRMTLVRGQRLLQLEGNARIAGDVQTLTSKNATLSFTEDERALKYLELRGSARVTPNPGGAADRPAMRAENITMSFYEDGLTLQHAALTGQAVVTFGGGASRSIHASWIDLFTAPDGRTLTRLQAKDRVVVDLAATTTTPGRRITSTVLSASGDEKKGLTRARFEGSPSFVETPATGRGGDAPGAGNQRSGTSTTLELTLGGRLDAIERAEFQQNATFQDGDVTGRADVAQYDEARGVLRLIPNPREPRRQSSVKTADMTVDGWTIEVWMTSQDLNAQGSVTTQMTRTAGSAGDAGAALFDGTEPVNGAAETLAYTKRTGTAAYAGSAAAQARLWQGQSQVMADRIVFAEASRNLNADGKVESAWLFESPAGQPAMKPYRVHADTFAYDEAGRTAVYQGSMVTLATADGDVEARSVTFVLAAASRTLESMRAERQAWATLSGGYEAVGDVLAYQADTEVYTLTGKADQETAQVKSPKSGDQSATPSTCTLTEGMKLELDRRTGRIRIPGGGQAPRSTTSISCSKSLRRGK